VPPGPKISRFRTGTSESATICNDLQWRTRSRIAASLIAVPPAAPPRRMAPDARSTIRRACSRGCSRGRGIGAGTPHGRLAAARRFPLMQACTIMVCYRRIPHRVLAGACSTLLFRFDCAAHQRRQRLFDRKIIDLPPDPYDPSPASACILLDINKRLVRCGSFVSPLLLCRPWSFVPLHRYPRMVQNNQTQRHCRELSAEFGTKIRDPNSAGILTNITS
jgi:hypothetical protein